MVFLSSYSRVQSLNSVKISCDDIKITYDTLAAISIVDEGDTIQSGVLVVSSSGDEKYYYISDPTIPPFDYFPSFLSLRYKPLILKTLKQVNLPYGVLLIYPGAGIQHPRGFGLASDIGLELNIPVIGITKKPLVGRIDYSEERQIGDNYICPVSYNGADVALFIRKKQNRNGIFLSVGHNISLATSEKIVVKQLKYRLPEPIRKVRGLIRSNRGLP